MGLVGAIGDGRTSVLGKTCRSLLPLNSYIPLLLSQNRVIGFITLNKQIDLLPILHKLLLTFPNDHLVHVNSVTQLH